MVKKVVFSAKLDHDIIKDLVPIIKTKLKNIELILHDPSKQFFDLEELPNIFGDVNFFIVKVASDCSLDLLHFAKLYNIPTLHDIDTVLRVKNKVSLDQALRKIFHVYSREIKGFHIPKSWTHNLSNGEVFKEWARNKLPIVLKSHFQHDKYMRFNFLVKEIVEIDKFCKKYPNFLYYDVYIQKFIESDGVERKVYVIGDKMFGIKRENPIYIYLREKPEEIDVDTIPKDSFKITDRIRKLASILSKELQLKIFGFDLIKLVDKEEYYLIDVNDFPGLRGIKNIQNVLAEYFQSII